MDISYLHEAAAQVERVACAGLGVKTHVLKVKSGLCNQCFYQRLAYVLIPCAGATYTRPNLAVSGVP
jgi:disulfide bond formation protein DsbB